MIARTKPLKYRRKPRLGDDAKYLDWVRSLPCLGCFASWYRELLSDWLRLCDGLPVGELRFSVADRLTFPPRQWSSAAHIGFSTSQRGLAQKYPDREAGPLCEEKHHSRHSKISIHTLGAERFFDGLALDRDQTLRMLAANYEEIHGEPAVRTAN